MRAAMIEHEAKIAIAALICVVTFILVIAFYGFFSGSWIEKVVP